MINAKFNKLMKIDQQKNKQMVKKRNLLMMKLLTITYLCTTTYYQILETKGHLESNDGYRKSLPFIQWSLWITLIVLLLLITFTKTNNFRY